MKGRRGLLCRSSVFTRKSDLAPLQAKPPRKEKLNWKTTRKSASKSRDLSNKKYCRLVRINFAVSRPSKNKL
jgi:hypothetical protein